MTISATTTRVCATFLTALALSVVALTGAAAPAFSAPTSSLWVQSPTSEPIVAHVSSPDAVRSAPGSSTPRATGLAATGADPALPFLIVGGLVTGGLVLFLLGRRRKKTEES